MRNKNYLALRFSRDKHLRSMKLLGSCSAVQLSRCVRTYFCGF